MQIHDKGHIFAFSSLTTKKIAALQSERSLFSKVQPTYHQCMA
ncbi:hypothetical protein W04_2810 [Pseudoalteromonas sp. SW0106-04]|nr:hypothetical protein W04_2810 [Pseudoalteromonas sp. SW0106-04]